MCRDEFQRRRKENLKRLRRQDYEHSNGSRSFKDESASIVESVWMYCQYRSLCY